MRGIEEYQEVVGAALALSPADETELLFVATDDHLTRFANNEVHQNVAETNVEVRVRVALGLRSGVASANSLEIDVLRATIDRAVELAQAQPENPDWPGLPEPEEPLHVPGFDEATASASPRIRAEMVDRVTRPAQEAGCLASGALRTKVEEIVVANSNDLFIYYPRTIADFVTVVMSDSGSGYAAQTSKELNQIDTGMHGMNAIRTARMSRKPIDVEAGEWDVVLDAYAVEDMVLYLAMLGLNGAALVEQRSFASGRMGEKVTGENVTITDNGLDPDTLPLPFDYEGVPRRKLSLIRQGVVKEVAWDRTWAARAGTRSTGHAPPTEISNEPLTLHLQMEGGETPRDNLMAGLERGLFVTRFNYTRVVHPVRTMMTGLTRDGTFLVEGGEIVAPVKNLRFTESYLDAFGRIDDLSRERRLLTTYGICSLVPSARIRGFHFTGKTEF